MKIKLKEYINTIFADAERRSPHNQRLAEFKEEMVRNLEEKYDDLIASGRTPAAAYNIAVAGVGDISDLLEEMAGTTGSREKETKASGAASHATRRSLTPEERERVERYRRRSAIVIPVAVALYILSTVPCIIVDSVVGVVMMFVIIAAATAMLIYNQMSKPKFDGATTWDEDEDDDDDDDERKTDGSGRPRRSPVYNAISGPLLCVTVCVYLWVSFQTGWWHITWMIFLLATAVDNIIKAIFDLRR